MDLEERVKELQLAVLKMQGRAAVMDQAILKLMKIARRSSRQDVDDLLDIPTTKGEVTFDNWTERAFAEGADEAVIFLRSIRE